MQVKDLAPDLIFVSDSQEVGQINSDFGFPEFDSYFVRVGDGEYTEVYGMYGIVPHLTKQVECLRNRSNANMNTATISKVQKGFGFEYVVLTETRFGGLTLHFNTVNELIAYLDNSGVAVTWGSWE